MQGDLYQYIFTHNLTRLVLTNKRKRKGKDKESYIFIAYITFNIFFDDELTTSRSKNYRFNFNFEKIK